MMDNINKFKFTVSDEVIKLGLKGIYMVFEDLRNQYENNDFENLKKKVLDSISSQFNEEFIKNNETLQGFRKLHDKVGRSNKKYISSPENLIRYIIKYNDIPRINLLVDIYNLVSLKYLLALGAHDLKAVTDNINLRITDGSEKFWPLGSSKSKNVEPGEYSYVDDSNEIICRLEVRQVEKTKIRLNTKDCFYIVQGNENIDGNHIKTAVRELITLTKKYCKGKEKIIGEII